MADFWKWKDTNEELRQKLQQRRTGLELKQRALPPPWWMPPEGYEPEPAGPQALGPGLKALYEHAPTTLHRWYEPAPHEVDIGAGSQAFYEAVEAPAAATLYGWYEPPPPEVPAPERPELAPAQEEVRRIWLEAMRRGKPWEAWEPSGALWLREAEEMPYPARLAYEMFGSPLNWVPWIGFLPTSPFRAAGRGLMAGSKTLGKQAAAVARELATRQEGFAALGSRAGKVAQTEISRLNEDIRKIDMLLGAKGKVPGERMTRAQFREARGGLKADRFLAETINDPANTTTAQVVADLREELANVSNEIDARAAPYHGRVRNLFPDMPSDELEAYALTLQKYLEEITAQPPPQAARTAMQTGMGIGEKAPQGELLPEYGAGTAAYKGQLAPGEQMEAELARRAQIAAGQLEMPTPTPARVPRAEPSRPPAKAPAPTPTVAPEPWQIPRAEYVAQDVARIKRLAKETGFAASPEQAEVSASAHRSYVKAALDAKRPVPPEVLKDYPDLVKPTPSPIEEARQQYRDALSELGKAQGLKRTTVEVTLGGKEPRKVTIAAQEVSPGLVIHRSVEPVMEVVPESLAAPFPRYRPTGEYKANGSKWVVTHSKSGYVVGAFAKRDRALLFARKASEIVDWTKVETKVPSELKPALYELKKSLSRHELPPSPVGALGVSPPAPVAATGVPPVSPPPTPPVGKAPAQRFVSPLASPEVRTAITRAQQEAQRNYRVLMAQHDSPVPLAGAYVVPEKPFWKMTAEELAQVQPLEPPLPPPAPPPLGPLRDIPPAGLRLPVITPIGDLVGRAFVATERPTLARWAKGKRGLEWAGRLLNPSAFADKAPEQMVIAIGRLQEEAGTHASNVLSQMAATLARRYPDLAPKGNPFTMKNAMVVTKQKGKEVEVAIGDLIEHFERYDLNDAQRQFCEMWADIAGQQTWQSRKSGVLFHELHIRGPGERFPRFVVGKNGEPLGLTVQAKTTIGAKQKFRNSRLYEEMTEAVQRGINYEDDIYAVMHADLTSHYIAQVHAQAAKWLGEQGFGQLPKARLMAWFPDVVSEAGEAARNYAVAGRLGPLVQRVRRGEGLHPSTLAAVDRYMPEFGQALRSTDKAALKRLVAQAKGIKARALHRLEKARLEYQKAKNIASAPRLGEEGTTQMPAFRGRIFDKETADYLNRVMGRRTSATARLLQQAIAVPRFAVTGFDLGVGTIHLLPLLAGNPKVWAKSQWGMLKIMTNDMYRREVRLAHAGTVEALARAAVTSASDFTEAAVKGGLLERVPVLGKVAGKAADMFEGALEFAQIYLWEAMAPSLQRAGTRNWEEQLGAHIAALTGSASAKKLGITNQQAVVESLLLFAPRYTRSFFIIAGDIARGGLRGDMARTAMAKFLVGGLASYTAACVALGQQPRLDPRDPHFLTVEVLGQRLGPGSVYVAAARALGQIVKSVEESPKDLIQLDPGRNPLLKFWYSRLSQPLSQAVDLTRGRNYLGEPLTMDDPITLVKDIVGGNLLPFYLQDFLTPRFGEAGELAGYPIGIAAQIGGARAYPVSAAGQRDKRRDEAAKQTYGLSWDELGALYGSQAQRELEQADPALQAATQEAHRLFIERAGGDYEPYAKWVKEREAQRIRYIDDLTLAQKGLMEGKGGVWFRQQANEARNRYYAVRETLDKRYPTVSALFDTWAKERATDTEVGRFKGDVAYDEYWDTIEMIGDDQYGEYDYKARDAAEERFKRKWGAEIWNYVQSRLAWGRKDEPVAVQELRQAQELLKPYWAVADLEWARNPQAKAAEDKITAFENKHPDETGAEKAKLMRALVPDIAAVKRVIRLKRELMRKVRPDIDAAVRKYY